MKRSDIFHSFIEHPIYVKMFNKLSTSEYEECLSFLKENEKLSKSEFTMKVNRWYLDSAKRPKHYSEMWGLMSNVAAAEKDKK